MTADLRVVFDAPPLLTGLLAQEIGDLVTIPCPNCVETPGRAYAHGTSGHKTTCHECWGETTIQVPASEIEPDAPCARCGGREAWQLHDGSVEECPACTGGQS